MTMKHKTPSPVRKLKRFRVTIDISAADAGVASSLAAIMAGDLSEMHKSVSPDPKIISVTPIDRAPTVVVHTDGGCDLKRQGVGAWAAVIEHPDGKVQELVGRIKDTTNNRMELSAVIAALKELEIGPPAVIVCDSEYVIKGTTIWARSWQKNGWKTVQGKDVLNKDLWEELLCLWGLHNARFEQVRGHSGVVGNERCDQLCTEAMNELFAEISSTGA